MMAMVPIPGKEIAHAVSRNDLEEVKRLLSHGSDPSAHGSLALRLAAENGRLEMVKLLLPLSDPSANSHDVLRAAAGNGHSVIVGLLLPLPIAEINSSLALQWASANGHLEVVRLLLPLSKPKALGSLALRWAANNGHQEVVDLLLPLSNPVKALSDAAFIKTKGCDFLLSCMPLSKARTFVTAHPDLDLPRTHARLSAQDLRHRHTTSSLRLRQRL